MTQEPNMSDLKKLIGHKVIIGCNIHGFLRYFGVTHFSEAACCGIELDLEVGNNDGSVDQIRYFTCRENYGIFIPANEAEIINDESGPYLKVSAFFPAVIENFIPNKGQSCDHEENLSPKMSSQDVDSDESLGILSHLCSLDELTEWDDLFYDNAVIISTASQNFDALPLSNSNNLKSLENDKKISNMDLNATIVHDKIAVSSPQTKSILSLDDLSIFHDGDECHENLNTTVVLQGNTVESDENERDLNTTIVLSDRHVDFENQKHDKLASDQTFASSEVVNENKTKDLNSTMVFPHRSIEAGNEFCIDLNTTVVLTDKPEEFDKCREVARFNTEEVSFSPINIFSKDSPKFASTPKQEINFSFITDERVRPSLPSCSADSQLNDLAKKEKIKAIPYEKNVAEHLSPIKPDDMILVDNKLEAINKHINISAHIPLPLLNETFDYAKFSMEEKVTQDFKESAFTGEMNIQDLDSNILEKTYKPVIQVSAPDEPDADVFELHKEEDKFFVCKNVLNSPHNVEKALYTNILKQNQEQEMNILNITHSVHEELEDKIGVLNLQENASEYGENKILDTTFQKVTGTPKSSKICPPKPCRKVEVSKVTSKTGRKLSIPFIRRDTALSKEQTEKKCLKFEKNIISRKSISHFGSSNFTNTEPRSTESQNRRNTLSSNKNSLLKIDEIKTINSTSQKNISSKYSIKENNNKNAASQQKHQTDTCQANITMIVEEKNERNIMSEDEPLLGDRLDNVIQKTSKNISEGNETKIIIHSVDEVIPQKSCEKDETENKDILGLIDSEKTDLPLQAPRSLHNIKSIPCLKTRLSIPTFRASSKYSIKENNNINAASQQKHQTDTCQANITMIVEEKNERNIMSEDEPLLGDRLDNVIQKTSKNISEGNETKIIIHSVDEVIPQKSCEEDETENKDILGLIDSEKTDLPLQAPRSLHNIKSIPCLKTRMSIPTFRVKSTAATSENVSCQKFPTQGTAKKTDKSPAPLVKKRSLKNPSVVAALVEKKSAIVRISEKCVSQKTITGSSIPSTQKNIRKLDIHNITMNISVPSKGVSHLSKRSATCPSMATAPLPETLPVDITDLPKKPESSLKVSAPTAASSPKKSENHPPRIASRIPQRANSLRIPRAVGFHRRGMVSDVDPNRTITMPSSQSVTRALLASKEKSASEKENPEKS